MDVWRKLVVQKGEGILVLENGQVVEYWPEVSAPGQVGSIYKGRVTGVLPHSGACLIDVGLTKPAFMDREKGRGAAWQQPRRGEWVIVQVEREESHDKGAKVSANIKLAGRWLVYMPGGKGIKFSRRIVDPHARQRLREWAARWLAEGEGVLFRTHAAQAPLEGMLEELFLLRSKWQKVLAKAKGEAGPLLLAGSDDLADRACRHFFNAQLKECVVDDRELYSLWQKVKEGDPTLSFSLTLYEGKEKLFDHLGLTSEIDRLFEKKVKLSSGGYLVIEETEALTVIDVNAGSSLGRSELSDAVYVTNLEAAREIARQIRLRNIGGIIIIDFVRFKGEEQKGEVLATLEESLKGDRTETHLLGFTPLGLVEMTRKKTAPSLWQTITQPCPLCSGRGRIRGKKG